MSYTGFWDELRKIPPVTRFLCGSSLAVTIPVMLQLLSPYKVVFVRALVTERFEVSFRVQREQFRSDESVDMEDLVEFLLWRYVAPGFRYA
jgi:hypothetical protein